MTYTPQTTTQKRFTPQAPTPQTTSLQTFTTGIYSTDNYSTETYFTYNNHTDTYYTESNSSVTINPETTTCSTVGEPQPHATCSSSGDPHYISFDGHKFDFQGTCRYILATVCNNTGQLPYFQVSARNEAWNGLPVSITIDVYVNVSRHLVHISHNMHGTIEVSNKYYIYFFFSIDFLKISLYDGSWVVRITVPGNYSGTTCGLCGNFNGQTSDDFLTSSGALGTSVSQFGASWKVQNDTLCSDGLQ
uniref:VWFD domain-containing protein n=1 Tax=Electrophorus electricus TaxID=8005 RepID=A0A4W4EFP4_ELEEL